MAFNAVSLLSLKENGSLILHDVRVRDKTHSYYGEIKADHCTLDRVKAFGDVALAHTTAQFVTSLTGNITWEQGRSLTLIQPVIIGCKTVDLSGVDAMIVKSQEGNVKLSGATVEKVSAHREIHLFNSCTKDVQGSRVTADLGAHETIIAKKFLYIEFSKARKAECLKGPLLTFNSTIDAVKCRQSLLTHFNWKKNTTRGSTIQELKLYVDPSSPGIVEPGNDGKIGSLKVKPSFVVPISAPVPTITINVDDGEVHDVQFIDCVGKVQLLGNAKITGALKNGTII